VDIARARSDQAAILGAIIAIFFTLDNNEGPWDWTDSLVGAAAGLILLGFAHLPDRPWTIRGAAQAVVIAAVGSLCLFLVFSPAAQTRFLPWVVGFGLVLLLAAFIWGSRLPPARDAVAKINNFLYKLTGTPASKTGSTAKSDSADPQLKPSDDTVAHRLRQRTDSNADSNRG
jgi:hypothetical protein